MVRPSCAPRPRRRRGRTGPSGGAPTSVNASAGSGFFQGRVPGAVDHPPGSERPPGRGASTAYDDRRALCFASFWGPRREMFKCRGAVFA